MDRVRVGVMGCGTIAQIMHLPFLRELDQQFEIAALCDVSPKLLAYLGDRYSVDKRYLSHHQLIADPQLDAILILSGGDHAPVVLDALRAGKHVLCEKPLTYAAADAQAVATAAAQLVPKLLMGYSVAFDPAVEAIRRELAGWESVNYVSLQINNPENSLAYRHLDVRYFDDVPKWAKGSSSLVADDNPVIAKIAQVIGGKPDAAMTQAFFTLHGSCIHEAYLLRLLFGAGPQIIDARAWDDGKCVATTLKFPGQVLVQHSWVYNYELADYRQTLQVVGGSRRLTATWPSPYHPWEATRFEVRAMEAGSLIVREIESSHQESFKLELAHFYQVCKGQAEPLHTAVDAVSDTRFLNAAAQQTWRNLVGA